MKRVISMVLVTVMLLACVPMAALPIAAESQSANYVCKIGDVGYESLDAAIIAANEGDVITLLADCEMNAAKDSGSYTIDGSDRKYTVTFKGYNLELDGLKGIDTGDCDITFKGVKLVFTNGYTLVNETTQHGNIVFDNCYITGTSLNIKHNGYGNITFKNNTYYESTWSAGMFYFRGDHTVTEDQAVITVENSTLKHLGGGANDNSNSAVFHFNSGKAEYKLNLIGNTVIENASTSATMKQPSIIYGGANETRHGSVVVNADSTVELKISSTAANLGTSYFMWGYTSQTFTFPITLKGTPQFVVTPNVAIKGVYLPNLAGMSSQDGKITYTKWTNGSSEYANGYLYSDASATQNVYFTPDSASFDGKVAAILGEDGTIKSTHSTLNEAIEAVNNRETIRIVGSCEFNRSLTVSGKDGINYTIDGSGNTYKVTAKPNGYLDIGNTNITFVGVNLDLVDGAIIQSYTGHRGDITFERSVINTYNNSFFKHNGRGNFTFRNTTFNKNSGDATVFYLRGDHGNLAEDEGVITLENTTITNREGSTNQMQNNCIFHINAGSSASFDGYANYKFNFKGTVKLNNESTVETTTACIFYNQTSQGKITMTIDPDAYVEFNMKLSSTVLTNAYFIYNAGIFDIYGIPTLRANTNVIAKGIVLPDSSINVADSKGGVALTGGWKDSLGAIKEQGYKYQVANQALTSFTPVVKGVTAENGVAYMNDAIGSKVYYETIEAALAEVPNNGTIYLVKDYTIYTTYEKIEGQNDTRYHYFGLFHFKNDVCANLTIKGVTKEDGTQPTLTLAGDNIHYIFSKTIVLDDLNIVLNKEIQTCNQASQLVFKNCDVTVNYDIRISSGSNGRVSKIDVINSTMTKTAERGGPIFYFCTDNDNASTASAPSIINVVDSHLIYAGSGTGYNACIFHDVGLYYFEVNVKGESILESRNASAQGSHIAQIEYEEGNYGHDKVGGGTFNFEPTARVILSSQQASTGNYFFGNEDATHDSLTINGDPIYEVNAYAAAGGVEMVRGDEYTYNHDDGFIGWAVTDGVSSSVYKNADITAGTFDKALNILPLSEDDIDFYTLDGAGLRTKFASTGIRFTTSIGEKTLALLGENTVFGTLMALYRDALDLSTVVLSNEIDENGSNGIINVVSSKRFDTQSTPGSALYRAAIVEIPDDAYSYQVRIAGRGYLIIDYADSDETYTIYSDIDMDNVRSMHDVAERLRNRHDDPRDELVLGERNLEAVNEILEVVGTYDTTPGTLEIVLPEKIYTNYPAVEIDCIFSKYSLREELTFSTDNENVKVENGKIYAIGTTATPYDVTVTATSENYNATTTVTVETYQGSTASGSSLNLETQSTTRQNQILGQSYGNLDDMVLFVGDSFFNNDSYWSTFYQDYWNKQAYCVGISSTTTEDWMILSDKLVYPYAPTDIVMHIGTNDIFDDKCSGEEAAAKVIALFEAYREHMPNVNIYWFNIEPRIGASFAQPKIANEIVSEYAADKDWLVVIDSASWCFLDNGSVDPSFFKANDTVHPAPASYALYRNALVEAGLVIPAKEGVVGNSIPDIIRDKTEAVATSTKIIYRGQTITKNYLVTGKINITEYLANAHVNFAFRGQSTQRFLLWDRNENGGYNGSLTVGWTIAGENAASDPNRDIFKMPGELTFKILFTDKNVYLYVNDKLEAVFYNETAPGPLYIGTEGLTATFTDLEVYTLSADASVYYAAVAEVASYEANTDATVRVETVSSIPAIELRKDLALAEQGSIIAYRGSNLVNQYVITGSLKVDATDSNPHLHIDVYNGDHRFLLWDQDNEGKFTIGWTYVSGGATKDETKKYDYTNGVDFKVLVTEKNAYLYVNGNLEVIFYNVPTISRLNIIGEDITGTVYNLNVSTKTADAADKAIYDAALAEVADYEALTASKGTVVESV